MRRINACPCGSLPPPIHVHFASSLLYLPHAALFQMEPENTFTPLASLQQQNIPEFMCNQADTYVLRALTLQPRSASSPEPTKPLAIIGTPGEQP